LAPSGPVSWFERQYKWIGSDRIGSDNALFIFFTIFFLADSERRIMVGYIFECGLYRTTDSDRKWSEFKSETGKVYPINTFNKTYFHDCKQYEQQLSIFAICSNFHQCEDYST
jgi:hypothetical protein